MRDITALVLLPTQPTSTASLKEPRKSFTFALQILKAMRQVELLFSSTNHSSESLDKLDSTVFSFLQTAHGDLTKLRRLISAQNAETPPSQQHLKHLAGMIACLSQKLQKIGKAYQEFKHTYYQQKFKRIKVFGELKAEYDLRVTERKNRNNDLCEAPPSPPPLNVHALISSPQEQPMPLGRATLERQEEQVQALKNSDLDQVIKVQSTMAQISSVIKQFSLKTVEQAEITEIMVRETEAAVQHVKQGNKQLDEAHSHQKSAGKMWSMLMVGMVVVLWVYEYLNTRYY